MKKYAIIGSPIAHSFSPDYFAAKFEQLRISDCVYTAIDVPHIADIHQVVKQHNLDGFNVTIPHKQSIIGHLDGISDPAAKMNAVNTVVVKNGKLYGYNTDYQGFRRSIVALLPNSQIKALILGNGGASRAVRFAFAQLGVAYHSVSRSKGLAFRYEDLTPEVVAEHHVIINTTPLGTYPNIEECIAIPYEGIGEQHVCYDLVYNPAETRFMKECKKRGAITKNGKQMLAIQADMAWALWNT